MALQQHIHDVLRQAEADPALTTRADAYRHLRQLGLGDFGQVLWHMPLPEYPRLSALLPKMASPAAQMKWTGRSGVPLLNQSIPFMRSFAATYSQLRGEPLAGRRVLDFGCGYGRFLRLAAFFSDDVWGVDPMDNSLAECDAAGLNEVLKSEFLPETLPTSGRFDAAFAFSVFTHLSERAARAALAAVRSQMQPNGVFCLTIRPVEYWRAVHSSKGEKWVSERNTAHATNGFEFIPLNFTSIDGEPTYGHTSMTLEWLANSADGWKIVATDRDGEDPMQRYVFLQPVETTYAAISPSVTRAA